MVSPETSDSRAANIEELVIAGWVLQATAHRIERGDRHVKLEPKTTRLLAYLAAHAPILFALCVAGAYAVSNSVFNVFIMFIFGGLAFAMHYFGYPVVPLLLGIILGPMAESNLKRALVISDGSPLIFVTRPISVVFIVLTVLSVYASIRSSMVKKQED